MPNPPISTTLPELLFCVQDKKNPAPLVDERLLLPPVNVEGGFCFESAKFPVEESGIDKWVHIPDLIRHVESLVQKVTGREITIRYNSIPGEINNPDRLLGKLRVVDQGKLMDYRREKIAELTRTQRVVSITSGP